MAKKILSQKMCASACERNWSAYGFIHSKVCNRLTNDRAKNLVFVFTNMRVQKCLTKIRNPHVDIYNRYYENEARSDEVRPSSTNIHDEDDNATPTYHEGGDFEDFDATDDADKALEGSQYVEEFLVRSAPDREGIEDYPWENDIDPEQYPTLYESQLQDNKDAHLENSNSMHDERRTPMANDYVNVNNAIDRSRHIEY